MKEKTNKIYKPRAFERTLIYIPIIHTQADMGALGESVRLATLRKLGRNSWKRKVNLINKIWTTIEQATDDLDLPYEKVRLYQDGLPVCGREAEIVTELAENGNRNYQLLFRLMERGAIIMGTESPELLKEEYELVKKTLTADHTLKSAKIKAYQKAKSDALLKKRDRFIATRINSTLGKGETGILFLGMLHSPEHHLDKDIHTVHLINRYHIVLGGGNDRVKRSCSGR